MTTAQPGQEQRMERARDMLMRRRKDAESLGGSAEIATEELDEAIAALTRPTADLGEAVARIEAAVDECSSDKASECLTADSFFQDAQTGRAIYVRDIRALLDAVLSRSGG